MNAVLNSPTTLESTPRKIGDLIDEAFEFREVIRAKQKEVDELKAQFAEMEQEIIQRLQGEGVGARANRATATVTKDMYPSLVDRDAFNNYLVETNQLWLYEARPSVTGCREIFNAGETIPGIQMFEKVGLSLRKVSK